MARLASILPPGPDLTRKDVGHPSMTLLEQMEIDRRARREQLRRRTREELASALGELLPSEQVIVFGSLTKPGRFTENSDVDIALENEPAAVSVYQLTGQLAERLGRPADVILLGECRFAAKIRREGEIWTPRD